MLDVVKAQEVLEKVADLLDSLDAKYWIDSGTLLGAYRDKGIIPYDHDIDLRLLPSFPEEKMSELVTGLWKIGFKVIISNHGKRAELICITGDKIMLDLKFAYQDKNLLWIYCYTQPYAIDEPRVHCYPRKFFEHMGEIDLLGRKYPTPTPIEGYLEHHYGEWREFKKRPEQADETDLSWDYMYSPPCAMSLEELAQKRNGASEIKEAVAPNKGGEKENN